MAIPAVIVTGVKLLIKWLPTKAGKLVLNGVFRLIFRGLKKGKSKLSDTVKDKCYKFGVYLSEQGNKASDRYKFPKFYERFVEPFFIECVDEVQKGMTANNVE